MHIPARILRRRCDDIPGQRPHFSFKEQDRHTRILDAAQMLMAIYGSAAIRMTEFALGLRMSPLTIRRQFPDMHTILGEILRRHLQAIVRAIGAVPADAPNRQQARRAAYLEATRILGAPTEAHLLLIRDRHLLPPDEAEPIEALRLSIGDIIAGDQARAALALLDTPELTQTQIEAALAAITAAPKIASRQAPATKPYPNHALQTQPTQDAPRAALPSPNAAQRPRAGPH